MASSSPLKTPAEIARDVTAMAHGATGSPDRKRCARCLAWKPKDQFYAMVGAFDGLQGYCKPCKLQQSNERNAALRLAQHTHDQRAQARRLASRSTTPNTNHTNHKEPIVSTSPTRAARAVTGIELPGMPPAPTFHAKTGSRLRLYNKEKRKVRAWVKEGHRLGHAGTEMAKVLGLSPSVVRYFIRQKHVGVPPLKDPTVTKGRVTKKQPVARVKARPVTPTLRPRSREILDLTYEMLKMQGAVVTREQLERAILAVGSLLPE